MQNLHTQRLHSCKKKTNRTEQGRAEQSRAKKCSAFVGISRWLHLNQGATFFKCLDSKLFAAWSKCCAENVTSAEDSQANVKDAQFGGAGSFAMGPLLQFECLSTCACRTPQCARRRGRILSVVLWHPLSLVPHVPSLLMGSRQLFFRRVFHLGPSVFGECHDRQVPARSQKYHSLQDRKVAPRLTLFHLFSSSSWGAACIGLIVPGHV